MYKTENVQVWKSTTTVVCDACGDDDYYTASIKVAIDEGEEAEILFMAHLCYECLESTHFEIWGKMETFAQELFRLIPGGFLKTSESGHEDYARNDAWLGEG